MTIKIMPQPYSWHDKSGVRLMEEGTVVWIVISGLVIFWTGFIYLCLSKN